MGTLWRSERMCLAQLFLQSEAAYDCVSALGELGQVQFKDLNSETNAFQRKFVGEVRRCDEMLRRLRYFETEIQKQKLHLDDADSAVSQPAPDATEMHAMELEFERLEREIKEITANAETLKKQELELKEMREILDKTGTFFEEAESLQHQTGAPRDPSDAPLLDHHDDRGQLGFVAGVVLRSKVITFERLLWRACRGNVFMRRVSIDEPLLDPAAGTEVQKDVFIVFFQGEQLEQRVRKICEGFEASLYPCPDNTIERREMRLEVVTRLEDLQTILLKTHEHLRRSLAFIASKHPSWITKVIKIKAVYHTMNKFDFDNARKSLLAECWCPVNSLPDIRRTLMEGAERSGTGAQPILNPINTLETPPTFFKTNKFTSAFQGIVEAYGVANYQEVNPTPFTIITFPFLFAVMFGDCGHGLIMALIAGYLIAKEVKLSKLKGYGEVWDTMFGGRYIIFLMGLFSIYTGFVYNDCFSKPLTLGSAGWKLPTEKPATDDFDLDPASVDASTPGNFHFAYPLGVDPYWQLAENKLTFSNSYKMKMSVILGITQMAFGVILSFFNHRHFRKTLNVVCEFIPQILFLLCIFGYLVTMILYKWLTPLQDFPNQSAPSLLLMLINMFLKFGSPPEESEVLYGSKDGSTQAHFQMALVVIAVICIPWMLLIKPCYLRAQHKRRRHAAAQAGSHGSLNSEDDVAIIQHSEHSGGHGHDEEEFEFGEVMVHQAIHTIEFCLGCISNTASYLRLWALSLAHSQLSEVLWDMVLHAGLSKKGGIGIVLLFCAFSAWAVATVIVLLVMEGLSAFLHALRLHWVEFQNKFYGGSGRKFAPFSLRNIVEGNDEELAV